MAGLRIGATLAVIGVTVGELVGGNTGLGYLITYAEGQANAAMVFNAIILLTVIGIVLYAVVAADRGRGCCTTYPRRSDESRLARQLRTSLDRGRYA